MIKKLNKEISISAPKAILFDTDNTLYEYEPANKAAIEAVYIKAHNLLDIDRKTFFDNYKEARLQVKINIPNTASSHSRLLYFQRMIELLGHKAELILALDLEQTYWRNFLANAPLFPHVHQLLKLIRRNNIPIGVITDLTCQIQLRKLTYFGLEDTFDAIVTSEEVGVDKPDPRNFELMLSKLNLKNMSNVWMIGDNPISDILGSKRLGAITFQKNHQGVELGINDSMPDFIFKNFKDLEVLLSELLH